LQARVFQRRLPAGQRIYGDHDRWFNCQEAVAMGL